MTESVHFADGLPRVICVIPAGATLLSVGGRIVCVHPDMPASYVTPTGLVPIPVCPPSE